MERETKSREVVDADSTDVITSDRLLAFKRYQPQFNSLHVIFQFREYTLMFCRGGGRHWLQDDEAELCNVLPRLKYAHILLHDRPKT